MEREKLLRGLDLVFSAIILIPLVLFVWPFVALAIFLSDGWPVIFYQPRVGKNGKVFVMPKFRTMKNGTENDEKPQNRRDSRIIPHVGFILRITNIDETTQFICVLLGKMSLVGPRPDLPGRKPFYHKDDWEVRTAGRLPGVTGRWALYRKGRIEISAREAVAMDLEKITIPEYLRLVSATPFVIIRRICRPSVYNIRNVC